MELTQGHDDLRLVSLGSVDVDPKVLTRDGGSLREATGQRTIDNRIGEAEQALPHAGWRLIYRSPPRRDGNGSETYAAPHRGDGEEGWALATVASADQGRTWILSADPGPLMPGPGRAARRAALSLMWPAGLHSPAGSTPQLTIQLRNQTDRVWLNRHGDSAYVRGWLLDADGNRLEDSPWFAYGAGDELPTLQPDEIVSLPVDLASYAYQTLQADTYRLDAVVVALDLQSTPGTITLT